MTDSRSKRRPAVFFTSTAIGLCVGSVLGFVLGMVVGWKSAGLGTNGSSEVLYSEIGSPTIPEYWFLALNHQKQPVLQSTQRSPFPIKSRDDHVVHIGPSGFARVKVPVGGTGFQYASAQFVQNENSVTVRVRCTIPESARDDWAFKNYVYAVDQHEIRLIEITQEEEPFNEWGGQIMFMVTIGLTILGIIIGVFAGVLVGFFLTTREGVKVVQYEPTNPAHND